MNINKNEIFKVLDELNISYETLMNEDRMSFYRITDGLNLYSQVSIKVNNQIIYFGIFPFAKEIKANNRNMSVIIKDSSGTRRQKFKHYQSWFPKIRDFYKNKGLELIYILYSNTSEFKNNKVLGFKAANPITIKECLKKNIVI